MLEQILELTKDSKMILLDCSAGVPEGNFGVKIGTRFSDSIYVTSTINICREWQRSIQEELISVKEIRITPEIKEEVNALLIHLRHVYFQGDKLNKGTLAESFSPGNKVKRRKTRRINEIKRRAKEEIQEYYREKQKYGRSEHPYGWLKPLNTLILDMEHFLELLPIYEKREDIPRRDENIPLNDYLLFSSAICYLRDRPESEVTILTRDHHFVKILNGYLVEESAPKQGRIRVINVESQGKGTKISQNVAYDFFRKEKYQ